jgi:hypothetical protein
MPRVSLRLSRALWLKGGVGEGRCLESRSGIGESVFYAGSMPAEAGLMAWLMELWTSFAGRFRSIVLLRM